MTPRRLRSVPPSVAPVDPPSVAPVEPPTIGPVSTAEAMRLASKHGSRDAKPPKVSPFAADRSDPLAGDGKGLFLECLGRSMAWARG